MVSKILMSTDWLHVSATATTEKLRTRALRKYQYDSMMSDIGVCTKCPLFANGRLMLQADRPCPLVMIGDAPSRIDYRNDKMFSGKAGGVIDLGLRYTGYTRDDVALMNRAACPTPRPLYRRHKDVHLQSENVFMSCYDNMSAQLNHTGAWVVLSFETLDKYSSGTKLPRWVDGRIWIFAPHPRDTMSAPEMKQEFLKQLRLAVGFAFEGEWLIPSRNELLTASTSERIIIGAVDVARRISRQGWAVINSRRIGERFLAVADMDVEPPVHHQGMVKFTLEELYKVGEFGPTNLISTDDFRAIYETKRGIPGTTLSR